MVRFVTFYSCLLGVLRTDKPDIWEADFRGEGGSRLWGGGGQINADLG